jgi:hypothetical protein
MSRRDGELEKRPERVIILDADDPMTEIHGRFVWQEEHDRVVDEVREQAFLDGYAAGQHEIAAEQSSPVQVELHRRRTLASKIRLGLLVLAAACIVLMLPVLVF